MAYSDFTIDRVRHELGITLDFSASLFDQVSPIAASDWLVDTLALMARWRWQTRRKRDRSLW